MLKGTVHGASGVLPSDGRIDGRRPTIGGEARIRFVGKPAGGTNEDAVAFEAPIRAVGASYFTNHVRDGPTIALPDTFLRGPSTWTATVMHQEDINARNDTISGKQLFPCHIDSGA